MATPEQIAREREYIAEPTPDNGWTDQRVATYIDEADGDLFLAAAEIWEVKAGTYASLVDVSESGSSRRMSDLHKNALTMAAKYRGRSDEAAGVGAPFTVAIRRK